MKTAIAVVVCALSSILFASTALAEQATPAAAAASTVTPATATKSARVSAWAKTQEKKFSAFRQCLNNRPAEAESYDCGYLLSALSKAAAKIAPKTPAQKPFAVAALK